jgi:hypothetical protein
MGFLQAAGAESFLEAQLRVKELRLRLAGITRMSWIAGLTRAALNI